MPAAVKQAHLDELEVQYQFNKTMARYIGNQKEEEHIVSPDRPQIAESKNEPPTLPLMAEPKSSSPGLTKMADPKKRSPSLSATELFLLDSTSELEDPSGSSDPEKSGIALLALSPQLIQWL